MRFGVMNFISEFQLNGKPKMVHSIILTLHILRFVE